MGSKLSQTTLLPPSATTIGIPSATRPHLRPASARDLQPHNKPSRSHLYERSRDRRLWPEASPPHSLSDEQGMGESSYRTSLQQPSSPLKHRQPEEESKILGDEIEESAGSSSQDSKRGPLSCVSDPECPRVDSPGKRTQRWERQSLPTPNSTSFTPKCHRNVHRGGTCQWLLSACNKGARRMVRIALFM